MVFRSVGVSAGMLDRSREIRGDGPFEWTRHAELILLGGLVWLTGSVTKGRVVYLYEGKDLTGIGWNVSTYLNSYIACKTSMTMGRRPVL